MRVATVTETSSNSFAGAPLAMEHLACHPGSAQAPLLDVAPATVLQLREAMRRVASAYAHAAVGTASGSAALY